jgi:hypothetical protein
MSIEARHPRNHPQSRALACTSEVSYSCVELSSESLNGSKVKLLETTFHALGWKHLSIDQIIAFKNIHTGIQIGS